MAGISGAAPNSGYHDRGPQAAQRDALMGLGAYERHKRFVADLLQHYGGALPPPPAGPGHTDLDTLREGYRFIRREEDDAGGSWEVRLASRYYAKLYREYAIADLSRHAEGRLGLRWRTQAEVVAGRGQFSCGAKSCEERRGLASFEVPFGYEEAGERKGALVKVRLCPEHAYQLNYKKHKAAEEAHAAAAAAAAKRQGGERGRQREAGRRRSRSRSPADEERRRGGGGSSKRKERKKERRRHRRERSPSATDEEEEEEQGSGRTRGRAREEEERRGKRGRRSEGGSPPEPRPGAEYDPFFVGLFD